MTANTAMEIQPSIANASPEHRLMMCMLSTPDCKTWGDPVHVSKQVCWDRFVLRADERVKPYLHWACSQATFESIVPRDVQRQFESARRSTGLRNLRWTAELREILAAFRKNEIPLMIVKGTVLQRTVYPDPSTRPMADMDLIVRRTEMPQIRNLMGDLGFRGRTTRESHTASPGLDADEEAYFFKRVGDSLLFVEIHTRLELTESGCRESPLFLWKRCTELRTNDGMLLPTLEKQIALQHLCLHLVKHGFDSGLLWLLDIRLFLDRYGASIDWEEFYRGCTRETMVQVAFTLKLAAEWLGADVPTSKTTVLPLEEEARAATLAWSQIAEAEYSRRPPNAVILALSGKPGRIMRYLKQHLARWRTPLPDGSVPPLLLFAKRFLADLRIFRAAFVKGGFRLRNIQAARERDCRLAQLHSILLQSRDESSH